MDDLSKLNDLNINEFLSSEEKQQLKDIFDQSGNKDWIMDMSDNQIKLNVKLINKSKNPNPTYQKEGDSGFDLMANIESEDSVIEIESGTRKLIPTGLFFQIPQGFEMQVRSRSGLALKHGIMVLNSPGTIDSGYRGEIGVILYNTGNTMFTVRNGDRIAQGVIAPVQFKKTIILTPVDVLDDSDRGAGGFGSTGK